MPVLKSVLWEYEEHAPERRLHRDRRPQPGHAAGSAVRRAQDADCLRRAAGAVSKSILEARGVLVVPDMQFITEAEHVHSSSERYSRTFDELKVNLGMDGTYC